MIFGSIELPKMQMGTLIKWLISNLSNLSQTLHSLAKSKKKQVAKIWSIYIAQ